MDCAHLPPRQGRRVGKPGRTARIFRPWMDEKRSTGVAFLLVTSLWPGKEKLPVRPGGGRKKTGTSPQLSGKGGHDEPPRASKEKARVGDRPRHLRRLPRLRG